MPRRRSQRRIAATVGVLALVTAAMVPIGILAASPASALATNGPQVVPGTSSLDSVACPTATSCVAVGTVGGNPNPADSRAVVVTVTNGIAGPAQVISALRGLVSVACPNATTCVAVGNDASYQGAVVTITNGVPGSPQAAPGSIILQAVACATASTCEAVGYNGFGAQIMAITNGAPSAPSFVPGIGLFYGIACSTSTTCLAIGSVTGSGANLPAALVTITNGLAGAAQEVAGTNGSLSVACGGPNHCQVGAFDRLNEVDRGLIIPVDFGVAGSPQRTPNDALALGLSCPDATTCYAVGDDVQQGFLEPITNGSPGPLQAVPNTTVLAGVSCFSVSLCVAVGHGPSNQGVVVAMGTGNSATITCAVTAVVAGPPKQQQVTVQSAAGLASITDIQVVNGTVNVAPFAPGTTNPVVVTATKVNQAQRTVWQFVAHDVLGNRRSCL